jgi:DNA-binding transcriptional LysR family regulator
LPWIYGDGYFPFQDIVDHLLGRPRLTNHRFIVQSSDEATKRELIGAGLGLALLEANEAHEAAQAGKLVIWQGGPIYCALSLAYLTRRAHEPLLRRVITEVIQVWGNMHQSHYNL